MNETIASSAVVSDAPPPRATAVPEPVRILHLTDIHYGKGFHKALWQNVEGLAPKLRPHVILVTGDLVNNPYWWTLKSALELIKALQSEVTSASGYEPKLYVIPGNHDTRLTGLLPVRWIAPIVLGIYAVVSIAGYFHHFPSAWLWSAPVVLVLLGYRYCCLRDFSKYFKEYIPELPTRLTDLNLILYPFDSATSPTGGAGGDIPLGQFVKARTELSQMEAAPYRMALVHHHSVPIPYDSQSEALMVLKNAGAFLSAIASCRVRLVLSGHKHHQHVSRVTINAETEDEQELTVLNTGSPTAGKFPGAFGHNFSFIEVFPQSGARITRYSSIGGPFDAHEPVWVDSVENCAKALLWENKLIRGFSYKEFEIKTVINEDGDAFRTSRITGFTYDGDEEIEKIPVPWSTTAGTGQIERPLVRPDPGSPVETALVDTERRRQYIKGTIKLTEHVKRGHKPFGFAIESHAINSYAMSAQQFGFLHPDRKTGPIEYTYIDVNVAPIDRLKIRVELPSDLIIDPPELRILRKGSAEPRLQHAFSRYLSQPAKNIIVLDMPNPPTGLRYEIAWGLTNKPPPAGRSFGLADAEAAAVIDRLLRLANSDPKTNSLSRSLIPAIESEARREFALVPTDPLHLTIMVFDEKTSKLRIAAGNLAADDPLWDMQLSYGDGIAGRAYKMNSTRLFIKAVSKLEKIPFYYTDGTGGAPTDTGDEIMEEVIISLPLSPPDVPDVTFGVLNISSTKQDSKLVNLTDDHTAPFRLATSRACFKTIRELS